jgi:hypothetical protein
VDKPKPVQQPVAEVVATPDGELLGPDEPWRAPDAAKPVWSFDKYLLDQYCQRLNLPLVTRPEELPPSGWLTEDEIKERHENTHGFFDDYRDRIRDARRQLDILGQLPPIETRPCGSGNCSGQTSRTPCRECVREREEHAARAGSDASAPPEPAQNHAEAAPGPDPATLDLNATADPSTERSSDPCSPISDNRRSEPRNLHPDPCNLSPVTCPPGEISNSITFLTPVIPTTCHTPHTRGAPLHRRIADHPATTPALSS